MTDAIEELPEGFGGLLKRFRSRSGLSQRALAERAGVDKSYVSRIEKGERKYPNRALVLEIAGILELTAEEADLWLISAGYVSPRMQRLAAAGVSRLLEEIDALADGTPTPRQS